ncbi:MAG: RNA polymerase sigma factor [Lysobacterales bacterium]|jgi:RNA polymerase sigma-70 factor (ECF subfamily)|nr:MAG: RNA polymerase sigma factor [Xanthomonadales bacterium]
MLVALAVGEVPPESVQADAPARALDRSGGLDGFLRGIGGRALVVAELTTRDREEALDLVQEAMLRFVRRYAQRPAEEWPALFHRILNRALVDWTRRAKVRAAFRFLIGRRLEEQAAEDVGLLPAPQRGPEQEAQAAELSRRLCQALAALPLRQRQVFLLRVWEGLSVEATAQALAIGEGSVKTHLFRALARLKEQLDGHR